MNSGMRGTTLATRLPAIHALRTMKARSQPYPTCTAAKCRLKLTADRIPGLPAMEQHFGSRYYTAGDPGNSFLYKYPNDQSAAPLWFHDHTLGATRLNVYAGLAGGYYIEDPAITPIGTKTTGGIPGTCKIGCLPANLQPLSSVIPLVLQDRMFDTNGQLFSRRTATEALYRPQP